MPSTYTGVKAAVLTVSDGVAHGVRDDRSGDLLAELLAGEGYEVERRVVPDEHEEIAHAPKDPDLLAHRLHNNTAASPRDAGGDIDAAWEDVNESGSESFAGDSPTPDQSMVEENAHAMGINFEDNEELDFDKIERRDRDRYELEEQSKSRDDTI